MQDLLYLLLRVELPKSQMSDLPESEVDVDKVTHIPQAPVLPIKTL